jgi:hypothetical protein
MKSCALIVGINDYPKSRLKGAVKDALNVEELLSYHENEEKNFYCKRLISSETNITLSRLRSELIELFSEEYNKVLFYFAGHGYENSLGGYLVTQDAQKYVEGLAIGELMMLANNALEAKRVREVILVLDCCHSGHLGNVIKYNHMQSVLMPGLTILTASSEKQLSAENDNGGLFTQLFCEGMKGAAADIRGRVTAATVYNYLDQVLSPWEQRPQFKTHSKNMSVLRKVNPKISNNEFFKLHKLFEFTSSRLHLNPTWEWTVNEHSVENVETFNLLKKFRDAGLIQVDEVNKDLYWAAINSGYVTLTLLGKLYWKMINKKMI